MNNKGLRPKIVACAGLLCAGVALFYLYGLITASSDQAEDAKLAPNSILPGSIQSLSDKKSVGARVHERKPNVQRDIRELQDIFANFDGTPAMASNLRQMVGQTINESNFSAVIDIIMTLSPGSHRRNCLSEVSDSLHRDPMSLERATAYIETALSMDFKEDRDVLFLGLEVVMLKLNPEALVQMSEKYGKSKAIIAKINSALSQHLAASKSIDDIEVGIASLNLDDKTKKNLVKKAKRDRAIMYPKEAIASWNKGGLPLDQELIRAAATGLVNDNPKQAADWITTLSYSDKIEGSIESVFFSWMITSSMDCSMYVQKMPTGPAKDVASRVIGQRLMDLGEKESAAAWLAKPSKN